MNTTNSVSAGVGKAVAYARVSTTEQADQALPAQVAAIRKYAQARGFALAGEYVEHGRSAADDSRPELRKMLDDVLRPSSGVSAIIVTDASRLTRDETKAREYEELLGNQGIRLIAIRQNGSSTNP